MDREEFLQKLRIYGKANDIPNITETNARFLRDLIKIQGTKNMLEIGTANGLSAICF
jgi:predicted O-methyltransferase YrrM